MSIEASSVLIRAATASGLLTPDQLHLAIVTACDAGSELSVDAREVSDEAIGRRLVELGYLNPWQVEQLKEGRTKFTLGPYRIVDAIGRGGMGHVFKAEHELLGRTEAIKVLPRNKTTADTIAKFRHEIRTQAQLDHPNLVRIHYADLDRDTYFFVTELVPGTDLRKLVRRHGPLPIAAASLIVRQAAEGLEHAHRRGLVHRDIKPGNLLVTPEGVTKLIDLGLAWYLESDIAAAKQGERMKIVGTADYLAPETIRSPETIVPISDIYSLGCTLYYAVTGKVPFPGGNPAEKMQRHLHETPLSPDQLQPNLPASFVDLVAKMMAKDPQDRPPSAAAVSERLREWAGEEAFAQIRLAVHDLEKEDSNPRVLESTRLEDTLTFDEGELDPAHADMGGPSQGTEPMASATSDTTLSLSGLIAQQASGHDEKGARLSLGQMVVGSVVIATLATLGVAAALAWQYFG